MDKLDASLVSLFNNPGTLKQKAQKSKQGDGPKGSRKAQFTETMKLAISSAAELGPVREYVPSEEALTELMDAVHSTGSDLRDKPFHDQILNYKKAVRNFVHYVVENSFEIEKFKTRRKKDTVLLTQIQVIDRKLEELAAAILSGQVNQLEKVSKIDEIKGLLIDLTVSGSIKGNDG